MIGLERESDWGWKGMGEGRESESETDSPKPYSPALTNACNTSAAACLRVVVSEVGVNEDEEDGEEGERREGMERRMYSRGSSILLQKKRQTTKRKKDRQNQPTNEECNTHL